MRLEPAAPNHKRAPRSRKVRVGRRLGMRRGSWLSVAVCGFLITLARAKAQSFREAFEQPQLPPIAAPFPVVVTLRPVR